MRKRREQTQSGYVRTEVINGVDVYVACYASYAIDPETGIRKRRVHRIQPPLGNVQKMSREQADKKKDKLVRDILGKQMGKRDPRVTFRWFVEHEFVPTKSPKWGPSTTETNRRDHDNHILPLLGDFSLEEITTDLLQKSFMNKLGESGLNLSQVVVQRLKTRVFSILEHAVTTEYITRNPADSTSYELPRCKPNDTTTAELADVGRLINAISDDRDFVIMKLASVGVNAAEIFGTLWDGLHLDDTTCEPTIDDFIEIRNSAYHGKFYAGRTKTAARKREAYIDCPEMKAALFRLREKRKDMSPNALIFSSRIKGKTLWSGTYLRKRIHPIARKLGIRVPMTFRVLRRTFMTWMDNLGLDRLLTVQGVVGHTPGSDVTRGTYVQPRREKQAQLVRYYAALCAQAAREYDQKRGKKSIAKDIAAVPLPVVNVPSLTDKIQ